MNRVLIITYYWPPSGGSGVQRWLKFVKYLPSFGWTPAVYTPENPEPNAVDGALSDDIPPGTEVIRTRIFEPYVFYKALSGKGGGARPIRANLITGARGGSFFYRFATFVRGNFFIPDPRRWWIRPSVRYLRRYLREHPADVIVSTGPPHSMHLIARALHRETGIPWIADFRDPWTGIFYFKHLPLSRYAARRHRRLEQSVLEEADRIVVVSDRMKADFQARTSRPVVVITNGFDPADFARTPDSTSTPAPAPTSVLEAALTPTPASEPGPAPESAPGPAPGPETETPASEGSAAESPGKFRIVHTGLFTENGNPDRFWEALGEKAAAQTGFRERLEIVVMGQTDPCVPEQIRRAGLQANFTDLGYVSHDTAIRWQRAASLLLLPLRKEPEAAGILTGKFFEYLASGAPVLAFGPAEGDLARALQQTGSGTICEFADKEGIRRALDRAWEAFSAGLPVRPGDATGREDRIRPYSRICLTQKLSGLLNELKKNA